VTKPADDELRASELTGPPPVLGESEPSLVQAGPAEGRPFLVEAEDVEVRGTERGGIDSVVAGGLPVLAALRTDAGVGANFVLGPCSCRRELVGDRGSILEALLVASALPLVAIQWRPPLGAPPLWSLEIGLTLLPDSHGPRYSAGPMGLRALGDDPPDTAVDLAFYPPPGELTVTGAPDGGLAVGGRFAAAGPVTLLVSTGPVSGPPRVVTAAAHLRAHELRCAGDAGHREQSTLITETGVKEIDDGVGWAAYRLRAALQRAATTAPPATPTSRGSDLFWSGLGALAVGDEDACLRALDSLRPEGETSWIDGAPVSEGALRSLLAARATLLTGNPGAALAAVDSLRGARLPHIHDSSSRASWDLWRLALEWLSDAVLGAAPETDIAWLREEAGRGAHRSGPVRLPMAGERGNGEVGPASLLRLLMGNEGQDVPDRGVMTDPSHDEVLRGWTQLRRGDIDEGYRAWRESLTTGLLEGPSGRGSWDPEGIGAPRAGHVLCGLAYGVLGLAPDAPSGRIRIAPSFPAHLGAFTARGIRLGDTRIDLDYRWGGGRHRFELSPTEGRVPATVIFEPSLVGDRPGTTYIDGQPTDLVPVNEGDRLRFGVQLPLDGRRTVEMEVEGKGKG
jgi:hypothetical protein